MLAALCLALALDPPTIGVDVDALALPQTQAEQLHGELMTRLVESGYPVGGTGAVTVRLTGGGEVVHVEVQHGARAWTRDVRGSGALLRLATIHAALELVAESDGAVERDPARAAPRERSVVVVADPAAASFVPTVIAALIDAGNVVVPKRESAALQLCVGTDGERPTIAAATVEAECPSAEPSTNLPTDIAAALDDARKPPPVIAPPKPIEAPPVVASPRPSQPSEARPSWTGAIGLGAGAEGRLSEPEALVILHGDARHRSGALLTVRASVAPSTEGALRVADTFVTAGAGYSALVHPRVRLEIAATLGVAVHAYALHDDRGARVDVTGELPATLAIVLVPRLELGLSAVAGVSGRARDHSIDGDVVWSRSRWRIGGLATLRVVLGRKPPRPSKAGRS
jgi:hypothetical protein